MVIKDLENYRGNILKYCFKLQNYKDILFSLHEDEAIDKYLDGKINHNKEVDSYEEKIKSLNVKSTFGQLYENSSDKDKAIIEYLLSQMSEVYSPLCFENENPTFQSMVFIKELCDKNHDYKDIELSNKIVDEIREAGHYIVNTMVSWDDKLKTMTRSLDLDKVISECCYHNDNTYKDIIPPDYLAFQFDKGYLTLEMNTIKKTGFNYAIYNEKFKKITKGYINSTINSWDAAIEIANKNGFSLTTKNLDIHYMNYHEFNEKIKTPFEALFPIKNSKKHNFFSQNRR